MLLGRVVFQQVLGQTKEQDWNWKLRLRRFGHQQGATTQPRRAARQHQHQNYFFLKKSTRIIQKAKL